MLDLGQKSLRHGPVPVKQVLRVALETVAFRSANDLLRAVTRNTEADLTVSFSKGSECSTNAAWGRDQ